MAVESLNSVEELSRYREGNSYRRLDNIKEIHRIQFMTVSRNITHGVFILSAVLFFVLNILTVRDGHNWGDDFGQYIQHAKNIIGGQPYASRIMVEPWVTVPPGFPLLLVPWIYFWGVNFKVLKIFNVILWQCFVLAFYPLMRKRLGEENALLGSLALLSSPFFFLFKQNVLSDTAFIFFVTLAILALMKFEESFAKGEQRRSQFLFWGGILLIGCSSLIRPTGVCLFMATIVYFLRVHRDKRFFFYILFVFILSEGFNFLTGVSGINNYLGPLHMSFGMWVSTAYRHCVYVLHTIVGFYFPTKTAISVPLSSFLSFLITKTALLLVLGVFGGFLFRLWRRTISLLECFFVVYFLGIMAWTIEGGSRYFLPIAGVFLILGLEGVRAIYRLVFNDKFENIREGIIRGILILLIAHNVLSIIVDLDFDDNEIYRKNTKEVVQWIQRNIQPEEHYMFWKPRALAALTDRVGTPFWIYPEDKRNWPQRAKKFKIDYLIIFTVDEYLLNQVTDGVIEAKEIWGNDGYKIFKVLNE